MEMSPPLTGMVTSASEDVECDPECERQEAAG